MPEAAARCSEEMRQGPVGSSGEEQVIAEDAENEYRVRPHVINSSAAIDRYTERLRQISARLAQEVPPLEQRDASLITEPVVEDEAGSGGQSATG